MGPHAFVRCTYLGPVEPPRAAQPDGPPTLEEWKVIRGNDAWWVAKLRQYLDRGVDLAGALDEMQALTETPDGQVVSNPYTLDERVARLEAENARLREALGNIAAQQTIGEMIADKRQCADFEGAYHTMIEVARAALARGAREGER